MCLIPTLLRLLGLFFSNLVCGRLQNTRPNYLTYSVRHVNEGAKFETWGCGLLRSVYTMHAFLWHGAVFLKAVL